MPQDFTPEKLTAADVDRLFSEPTEDARQEIAQKVASQFSNVVLMPRERELAQEILGFLVLDVCAHVRAALALALSDLPNAPHDIVLKLAHDIDEVAEPVLLYSTVLSDEDLAELVLSGSPKRQRLIAGRPELGPQASGAIASTADRETVLVLIANEGAIIQPEIFETILQRYPGDEGILDPMAQRNDLPLRLVERIVTQVAEHLRHHLVDRYGIAPDVADVLEVQARERSLVEMLDHSADDDLECVISQLALKNQLTPALLLRAVCAGKMKFVERGFAVLTSIKVERASRLIHDVGPLGFRALHARAGIPELYFPAFRAGLDVLRDCTKNRMKPEARELSRLMMERIAPHYRDIEADDLDLLLDRLTRRATTSTLEVRAA